MSGDYEIEHSTGLFIILGVVAVLIISSNMVTVMIIAATEKLRNPTGYFMISLATADFFVGLTTLIPLIYSVFSDYITKLACDMMGFLSSVVWVVSVYTLMLLSIDRYIAIQHPLHYNMHVNQVRSIIAISLVWAVSGCLWVLPLAGVGAYKFNDEEVACYFNVRSYPTQWIVYMVLIFAPTSCCIIVCYWKILQVSRAHQHPSTAAANNIPTPSFKAVRTTGLIVGAFYVAWLPFIVEHIIKAVSLMPIPEWLEIAIFVIAISNSFWNPVIYIGTNRVFRFAFFNLLQKCCPCCRLSAQSNEISPESVALENGVCETQKSQDEAQIPAISIDIQSGITNGSTGNNSHNSKQ